MGRDRGQATNWLGSAHLSRSLLLTLKAFLMSIGASSWTAVGLNTLRTSQEDSIVSAGEWAGPCCVHCV